MRKSKRLAVKRETIRPLTAATSSRARGAYWHDDNCTARPSGCWSVSCGEETENCSLDCSGWACSSDCF